ncbi:MAG: hypothetical protein KAT32_03080 [Candidatus Moranbacteria bacterium]|nr:hypothetical protein [Candidatus Moranbacteria bacterium]
MDIIIKNKKRLTICKKRTDQEKIKKQREELNKNNQAKYSLDGIGKKIPSSSIRCSEQISFLNEARRSFKSHCHYFLDEKLNSNFSKKSNNKKIISGFKCFHNSQKFSSSNYYSDVNFSSEKKCFLNRKFIDNTIDSSVELEKKEKSDSLISSMKLWKFSLVGAMVFGMVVMGFVHQNLGDNAFAKIESKEEIVKKESEIKDNLYFSQVENYSCEEITDDQKKDLEQKIRKMVAGQPIENMIPYILEQDYHVAAYLIAIAKKESQWGNRVPVLNGKDCYNYWGYRENRDLMGSAGHTCFNSRKDAVETVGKRLDDLIYKSKKRTSASLIVWKCGSTCEGHSQAGVDSWIDVVDMYYGKLVR